MNITNKHEKMINDLLFDTENYYKEDLKQELYLTLLNLQENQQIKNIDNYVFICLKNKKMQFLLNEKKHLYIPYDENIYFESSKELDVNLFNDLISQLNKKEQYIIKSIYFENKKQNEVAKKLNISPQNLNNQIKRICNKLKNQLNIN